MVASFVIFIIIVLLRVIAGTLTGKFSWMTEVIPYLNYACIGGAVLFGAFIIIALIRKIIWG